MTTPIPDADQLLKLLSWRQRRKVAKRLIITSCDLTYSGYLKHRQGTCEAHGRSSGPLPQVEHITTDPRPRHWHADSEVQQARMYWDHVLARLADAIVTMDQQGDGRIWSYPLSKRSGVRPGLLYPQLARMMTEGWLEDSWESQGEAGERPPRRYYTVTDEGRAHLYASAVAARRAKSGHARTDPDCIKHRPPRGVIGRWWFDRGRGRSCPVCHPWPQQMGEP